MYFVAKPNEEAKSFIQAAGLTNETQMKAIGTLVFDLKNYNIWDKMKAIYPMVGQPGVSSSFEFNLKDPNIFRGTFYGGWTFASNGATPNGTNAYMNTNLSPSNSTYTDFSWGYYINTDTLGTFGEFGVGNGSVYVVYDYPNLDGSSYTRYGGTDLITAAAGNTLGFYTIVQTNGNLKRFKDGLLTSQKVNIPASSLGVSTLPYYFSSRNENGTFNFPSNRRRTFNFISDGLTDTEAANFYTAVQRFQTTLGRQV